MDLPLNFGHAGPQVADHLRARLPAIDSPYGSEMVVERCVVRRAESVEDRLALLDRTQEGCLPVVAGTIPGDRLLPETVVLDVSVDQVMG